MHITLMPRPIALYNISEAAQTDVSELVKITKSSGIKEFVIATINKAVSTQKHTLLRSELIEGLLAHKVPTTSSRENKGLSVANSMIARRVKELEALGCLRIYSEYRLINGKKKKANIYEISTLAGLKKHLNNKVQSSPCPQGRPKRNSLVVYSDILEKRGITKLEITDEVVPYTESAFSILEAAARSRADKNTIIQCRYYIKKNDFVDITSSTSTKEGSGIMYSSDQRIIQALNGMLKQVNDRAQAGSDNPSVRISGEYCFFDIYELTKEIGLKSRSPENRVSVRKMIERLRSTTYSVDAANSPFWREKYMPADNFTKGEYNYITEFYSAEDWYTEKGEGSEDTHFMEDRYFVVKFHPLIFKAMTTPKMSFISHDSLKRERLDLVHRLNNWVKPTIGVRDKGHGDDHHKYPLDIFHQRVSPASRLDNFERQFFTVANRQDSLEDTNPHDESVRLQFDENKKTVLSGVFWLNGYYFKIEKNKKLAQEIYRKTRTLKKRRYNEYPVITIWRDRKDNVVGDDSMHNQALRRQMNSLIHLDSQENSGYH